MGVQTFVIPMIDTRSRRRPAPRGLLPAPGTAGRGVAARAWWNQVGDYLHRANDELCLIVQAETLTALTTSMPSWMLRVFTASLLDLRLGRIHGQNRPGR